MGKMKTSRRNRQASKLPPLRWSSYAIAAGATAAGAIATAEAEIHYSGPVDYKFQGSSTFKTHRFPLSRGAYLIGAINHVTWIGYDYAYFGVANARLSNSVRGPGNVSGFCHVAALPGRSVVSAGEFSRAGLRATMQDDCTCPDWQDRGTYYVGFRFNDGGGQQYGWARIRWGGCPANDFIVKDYAWGDIGDQIKTGQRQLHEDETQVAPQAAKSDDAAPPADSRGSLGLLALGAVGLQAWRAKRIE
jgi:hypothetical protein